MKVHAAVELPSDLFTAPDDLPVVEVDPEEGVWFDHIPFLEDILEGAGWPGLAYTLSTQGSQMIYRKQGWEPVMINGQDVSFEIKGPMGTASVVLLRRGDPIIGQGPTSGARAIAIENYIARDTGLSFRIYNGDQDEDGGMFVWDYDRDKVVKEPELSAEETVEPPKRRGPGRPKKESADGTQPQSV